jgi:GrpB-like predicted nucleotidyltransferase (UPF0157 family)
MKVIVTDHNPAWPAAFEREAAALRPVFGEWLVAIQHIGSTAVPGLKAKPVIDIMPIVTDISAVDALVDQMSTLGYATRGEGGIAGRRYFFRDIGEIRTHNVHVFAESNTDAIVRHLAVRDYLRAHPDAVAAYGALKADLAQRVNHDIEAYMDGKDEFVQRLQAAALKWYRSRRQEKPDH